LLSFSPNLVADGAMRELLGVEVKENAGAAGPAPQSFVSEHVM
jgi:hypothetical protein